MRMPFAFSNCGWMSTSQDCSLWGGLMYSSCPFIRLLAICFQHCSLPTDLNILRRQLLHVPSAIVTAVDHGNTAALVLLDVLAVFDTVDYNILLKRLAVVFQRNWKCLQMVPILPMWPFTGHSFWASTMICYPARL
jgi:hypothetical protein